MTPPTINAYYTQSFNSIFFPAAILQPPFFDPNADDAVNYGGIGAVIGHEISHGFDDQGSKYDGAGILQSWWTDEDRKAFEARTGMLGAQFDSYEGAARAARQRQADDGREHRRSVGHHHRAAGLSHLAGRQAGAGARRLHRRPALLPVLRRRSGAASIATAQMRQQIMSNPHSPPQFRVIGATRNIDAWYDAFDVKPGDKYYLPPEQRVHLW